MLYSNMHLCIQARMNSSRLPGKVIMDIEGLPLIVFLYNRLKNNFENINIVVLTSINSTDDKLVEILSKYNIPYFRGNLENVLLRFVEYEKTLDREIEFIGRICADSPYLEIEILKKVIEFKNKDYDIITTRYYDKSNVLKSTAPKGNNFDLINRKSLSKVFNLDEVLSEDDKEHIIFPFMRKSVLNIDVSDIITTNIDMAIDTIEDLERIRNKV